MKKRLPRKAGVCPVHGIVDFGRKRKCPDCGRKLQRKVLKVTAVCIRGHFPTTIRRLDREKGYYVKTRICGRCKKTLGE